MKNETFPEPLIGKPSKVVVTRNGDTKSAFASAPEKRLLRLRDVIRLTGRSRSSIYEDMAKPNGFPRPVTIGPRAVAWRQEDLHAWIDQRES